MKLQVWKSPHSPFSEEIHYHACTPDREGRVPDGAVLLQEVEADTMGECAALVDAVIKADAEGELEALRVNLGLDDTLAFEYIDISKD